MLVDRHMTRGADGRPVLEVRVDLEGRDYSDMATVTEDALRQLMQANQWRTQLVPGHRSNAPGPDLVAYKRGSDGQVILRILDNKATHPLTKDPTRRIYRASGLNAMSMARSLAPIVRRLRASTDPLDQDAIKAINQVRLAAVQAARAAARRRTTPAGKAEARRNARIALPKGADIKLVVTNVGGRAKGIGSRLAKRGVQYVPWWDLELLTEILELGGQAEMESLDRVLTALAS